MAEHSTPTPGAVRPRRARRSRTWAPSLRTGVVMGIILVLVAILAPIFLGAAATELGGSSRQGPSATHWLGTDLLDRDVLARALVATRLTLIMSLAATAVSVVLGVLIGGLSWLAPRWLRETVLRIVDASVAFPSLVLALVIAAILGGGTVPAVIAIGLAGIPGFARLTSNMVAGVIQRDFVTTSRLLGVPSWKLFTRHLLPNISGPLLVVITSSFALSLLEISSLSFVGLGVQSPEFDYGQLLNDGLTAIYAQPWQAIAPSIMLIYAGITAMLIGDGLAQTIDPGLRARMKANATRTARSAEARTAGQDEGQALVQVENLSISAPNGAELVKGVDFTIHQGEVLGLVGESGSGKSTTAMAVAGLLPDGVVAQADALRLGDMDLLRKNDPRRLATEIGLVYQDPGTTFNPALRMGGQLGEVLRVHLGMGRASTRAKVEKALERFQVRNAPTRMRQHAYQWSGGMLQRATIGSAMLTDPRLIIADEPTTALDVTVQAEVLREFRRINRDNSTAMLFISHDISVVQELCDTVLVMKDGRFVERVSGEDLKAHRVSHPYTRQLLDASPTLLPTSGPTDTTPRSAS
jgi:peptide/nickel transport system permease protein